MRTPGPPAQALSMELRLLGARGVREGSLLSIKVGSKRCYVPYHAESLADSFYKFPNLAGGPEQVKLDVYEPVAHARLLVEPSDTHWDVGLVPRPAIFGQEEDECGHSSVNTAVDSEPSGDAGISLEFEARSNSAAPKPSAGEEEPAKSPQISTRETGRAERKHQGLLSSKAQPYVEKHNLLKVMQMLLKSVMTEKPLDPYAYMVQVLQSKSLLETGKKVRPQSAVIHRPPETPTHPETDLSCAARHHARPQTAISRARPQLGQLPMLHTASCLPTKLSPKRPAEPLAPVGKAKLPPPNLSVPRLGSGLGGPTESDTDVGAPPAGAARNVASRLRTHVHSQSTPSLTSLGPAPPLTLSPTHRSPLPRPDSPAAEPVSKPFEQPNILDEGEIALKTPGQDKFSNEGDPRPWNTTSSQSTASQVQRPGDEGELDEAALDEAVSDKDWSPKENDVSSLIAEKPFSDPVGNMAEDRPCHLGAARQHSPKIIDSVVIGDMPLEIWSPSGSGSDAGLTEVASIPDQVSMAAGVIGQECRERLQALPWGA